MLKLAYRIGKGNLDVEDIRTALKVYKPTQLYGYRVENGITLKLKDIIGKKEPLSHVKRIVQIYRNEGLSKKLGLRRANLLLFHGPPGTGKTFMAKALAGEIGFPLITISGGNVLGNPFQQIHSIGNMAKRYRNCVIFIDEAEKIFGNERFGSDNPLIGEFNRALESVDGKGVRAIFILAVNDLSRFGEAFRDRFVFMPFNLPSYEERYAFCSEKALRGGIEIDIEYLARISEGISYREMERIWGDLLYHYLENKDKITAGIISSIVKPAIATETIFG